MSRQPDFPDPDDRYALLSTSVNPLGRLALAADVEAVRSRREHVVTV